MDFSTGDIITFIKALDPNNAHEHNGLSVHMIERCTFSISKSLHIVFKNWLENEHFFNEWKKANIFPAYKKGDKLLSNNYRPVSLLPICTKVFEKIIFNSLFEFLDTSKLLNKNQSVFHPSDSCVHQLLSVTHEIYKAFNANPSLEVRGAFLDLSKAFERVWHEGLIYKLKCLLICEKYYWISFTIILLGDRFQIVVLNGQSLNWCQIKVWVSQSSILGPSFFEYILMIYLKD